MVKEVGNWYEVNIYFCLPVKKGGLAQLARASAWHVEGHRFDSDILHGKDSLEKVDLFLLRKFSLSVGSTPGGTSKLLNQLRINQNAFEPLLILIVSIFSLFNYIS